MQVPTPVIRILVAFVVLSSVACYDYARVPFESLHPGMEVRTAITGAGLDRIRGAPGQGTFSRLELAGEVVDVVPDTLYLGVPLSTFGAAAETPELLKAIPISRTELTGTEERRLDRRKTFVAVALGSIATAYAVYRLRGGGVITPTTTVTSPPENRIPVRGPRLGLSR
jgi:hypothetical protein